MQEHMQQSTFFVGRPMAWPLAGGRRFGGEPLAAPSDLRPRPVHSLSGIARSFSQPDYSSNISDVSIADVAHEMASHDEVV
jgi:hypothetical protein